MIGSRLIRFLPLLALVITVRGADLVGVYVRSWEPAFRDSSYLKGLRLTLRADGTYELKTIGETAARPDYIDVIATEDGDWIQVANGIQLRTPGKAGKPADGPTLVIVESQGRSALLLQGESGLPTEFQQMLLLLKERAEALPPGMTKAAYIREKEQTWEDLASNVPKANGSASNSYVGQIVAFQGTRASYGSEYLLVSAKSRSGVVRCQMRTDIDGARNAELWVAAMVGVYVEGRVLSINPSTKIVEIEPISANVVWAR